MDLDKLVPMTGDIILNDPSLESNSTFNIDKLNRAMRQIAIESYGNLYNVQKCKVGLVRFDVPFSEFILETRFPGQSVTERYPKQYVHYFKYSMINVGREETYRRSDIYEKILTMDDISKNQKIFDHNFLVFIDGKLVTTCELFPMGDTTRIRIDVADRAHTDGISADSYNQFEQTDPMVTVLFVPNFEIYKTTTNLATLKQSNFTFDQTKFPILDRLQDYDGVWMFTNVNKDPALCVKVDGLVSVTEDGKASVDNVYASDVTSIQMWYLCFRHGLSIGHASVTTLDPYFNAHDYKFPVPTENILIFQINEENGAMEFAFNQELKKYYPNMYEVCQKTDSSEGEDEDTGDEEDPVEDKQFTIDVFYDDRLTTESEKYKNDIAFYMRYIDIFDRLRQGTIEEILSMYEPASFTYSEYDYEDSIWVPHIINYKIAKLREFLMEHPQALETYWKYIGSPCEKYYLDMKNFSLEERYREDTSLENPDIATSMTFGEPCYVFAMKKEFDMEKDFAFRIWIDGIFTNYADYHLLWGYNFYYIYIPTTLLTETSLIEIERYRLISDIHLNGYTYNADEEYIAYTPPKHSQCQARDIIVVDQENQVYLEEEQYELRHYSKYLDQWVVIPHGSALNVAGEEIHIHILDVMLHGHPITYGVYQSDFMTSSDPFNPDGDNPTLIGSQLHYIKLEVPNYGNYDDSSFRMFMNGRMCTDGQFYLRSTNKYGGMISARTSTELQAGDVLTLDRVPGNYRTVVYREMIDERGYVDLDGEIPLPLSFKWYDIYLNGIRLNRNMVDFVSPTKMYIHDVNTRRNLYIVERNHDDDVFYLASFAYKKAGYSSSVMDELMTISIDAKAELDAFYSIIIDTDRDYLEGGTYSDEAIIAIIIFEEYLRFTFFNPNDTEASAEKLARIQAEYPDYYAGGVFDINGNLEPEATLILYINANENL